jgi:hypothetical protein
MLQMAALACGKHRSKSMNEGCRTINFIIINLYTGFSIQNATEKRIACFHFLLVKQNAQFPSAHKNLGWTRSLNMGDLFYGK